MPCVLDVPAGDSQLDVNGERHFTRSVRIPNRPASVAIRTHADGGMIMLGVGTVLIGLVLESAGWYFTSQLANPFIDTGVRNVDGAIGIVGIVAGVVLIIVGPSVIANNARPAASVSNARGDTRSPDSMGFLRTRESAGIRFVSAGIAPVNNAPGTTAFVSLAF